MGSRHFSPNRSGARSPEVKPCCMKSGFGKSSRDATQPNQRPNYSLLMPWFVALCCSSTAAPLVASQRVLVDRRRSGSLRSYAHDAGAMEDPDHKANR